MTGITLLTTLVLGLVVALCAADAQQPRPLPRIAFLALAPGPSAGVRSEALAHGLRELGYVEGQNLILEYWWSAGNVERLRANAAELVRRGVHIIVTGGSVATRAAKEMTHTIPIVMAGDSDPVGDGFVASLGQPGGNITGVTTLARELNGKRLEMLKATVPGMARVAVLWNPVEVRAVQQLRETEDAAHRLGLHVHAIEVRELDDLAGAFAVARAGQADGLTVLAGPGIAEHPARLVDLAAQNRLPAIYLNRVFVDAGGLMSYAASNRDLGQRAASYVDRILKGAKPADLPVEQPAKFELVINLKTAQTLGVTIPPPLLLLADEVMR
jgi:putative tryptophan/tyrosine transport system substrate-binding protein